MQLISYIRKCNVLSKGIVLYIVLFSVLTSCNTNWNIFGEWDYKLPNGYQISRLSGDIIILHTDRYIPVEGKPDELTNVMINSRILSFNYNERYIGIQWIDPLEIGEEDINTIETQNVLYYLVDSELDIKYGAFETEEEFNEFCRSKSIENIFDWIKTSPAPKGATY